MYLGKHRAGIKVTWANCFAIWCASFGSQRRDPGIRMYFLTTGVEMNMMSTRCLKVPYYANLIQVFSNSPIMSPNSPGVWKPFALKLWGNSNASVLARLKNYTGGCKVGLSPSNIHVRDWSAKKTQILDHIGIHSVPALLPYTNRRLWFTLQCSRWRYYCYDIADYADNYYLFES